MELQDLKSGWQNAGGTSKSEADLHRLAKVTNHPSLKRIRTKLIVETIGAALFLFVYYDWFDGAQKPFYANLLLATGIVLFILNDMLGYISILKPITDTNLKRSIENYLTRIKRLSIFSLIISFVYSISIIVFFTSVINFTAEKKLVLGGIIVTLLLMIFLSFKTWNNWIKKLNQQAADFGFVEEKS